MNGENQAVANQVRGPAIGLLVTGALGLLAIVGNLIGMAFQLAWLQTMPTQHPEQIPEFARWITGPIFVGASLVFGLVVSGLVIWAGLQMRKLRSYGLVLAGTILGMVPCLSPCCCVGLPIGIWALYVLLKPEVKQAFH